MYDTSDFRKGLKVEISGEPFVIIDFQHVKPGKGNQFTRTRLKSLLSGSVLDRTYKSGEKVGRPDLADRDCMYMYADGDMFNFMDERTYEQFAIPADLLGNATRYLIENLKVSLLFFHGRAVNIDLPNFVELEVTSTDPGVKGDTASGGTKPAELATGLVVQVPFHINEGDVLKIDTRTGQYVERARRA